MIHNTDMEKAIYTNIEINAPLSECWNVWTTKEGIQSFFSPDCYIELKIGGAYENYFNPDAKTGEKGGEGNKILAIQEYSMLSFTWNAPPHLPDVRNQRTHVVIRFKKISEKSTKVILHHDGWGSGGQWDEAYEYFKIAWEKIVLPRLKYRFDFGSIDWSNPPNFD